MASFDPRGMVGRIYKERITKHFYTQKIKALGLMVSEKKIFFCFTSYKYMEANDHLGVANLDPKGYDWQNLCTIPLNIATY